MVRYEAIFHEKGYAIFVGRRLENHYRATGSIKGVTIDPQAKRLVFDERGLEVLLKLRTKDPKKRFKVMEV